ncbi:MAG: outer membrane lipoprotein-sorting protein [Proteobacteria bacterium]|nr:outer membrane lipoprotein-sorting protein [Pseudomonadota bacterium]
MKVFVCVLFSILCSPFACFAQSPAEKGLDIAIEADRRGSGFGDLTADMEMVLRNQEGSENRRRIRIRIMETVADGDKGLTIFDSPGDVRGTALLTYGHKVGDDDQWLYLPALKRVKRISARNKSGAFMGSEFSYEDFGSIEVEKYTYQYLGEETLAGRNCYIVQRSPVDTENSGYSRIVSWLDQDDYRIWKEEYYDSKNRFLKTLSMQEYHLYLGTLWKAHEMRMVNHQKGKETDLLWSNFSFRTGLSDSNFDQNSLKRAK